jgi:hypothetical protein
VSVQARERLPQPYAITAAVSNDVLSRTLVVRLPETEVGYSRLLWREAFAAYSRAEESGWSGGTAPLWALRWVLIGLPTRCLVISKR